ncbi:uncharacterized protein [Diadema setosum]|uniref:uncharacterized protein n=1 Tax=Diadema setosum TaxID=31175 RepID=UPI003B3AC6A5
MRVGSMVTLECDEGYRVSGSATLLCVTSSDENTSTHSPGWNASIPSCQPIQTWVGCLRKIAITSSIVVGLVLVILGTYIIKKFTTKPCTCHKDYTPKANTRNSADKSSLTLHDIKSQQGEGVVDVKKEVYMNMSSTVKKEKGEDVMYAESTDIEGEEKDIDGDSFLLSGASDHCAGYRSIQAPIYEDIPTTSNQSSTFLEPHYVNEVLNIDRTEAHKPPALSPLYSVSIYSSKPNEKPEVDKGGYLVLEANAGEIIDDQLEINDYNLPAIKIPLYENETSGRGNIHEVQVHANPPTYESILSNPEL